MAKAKKLPSGSWRVQAKKSVNGTVMRKSFTDADRKKAERAAIEWQTNQEEEQTENITLEKAYERYIESKKNILSPSTVREYKRMSESCLQSIMKIKIDSLTQEAIQRSINLESVSHSPKSVRNIHGLLSAVLLMFRPSMTLHTSLPAKQPHSVNIPDDTVISKVIKAVSGTKLEIPVLLAAFGPMRRGEICALTSKDLKGNTVTVNKSIAHNDKGQWEQKSPKTFAGYREIEFPDFVIDKMKCIKGKYYSGSPDSLTLAFRKALEKNGIPHFRFHDLRHYNVSILHAMGIPDQYIMSRGGWKSNYTMNNVYNHALKDKKSEFEDKISNHFERLYK